jgi:2,5-diketo-D-gluconate reductase A
MIKNKVQIEAWAPFGEGRNNMFTNSNLEEIGKKYNKTVAQVILRWLIQREVVALAKSTHIERMEENFNIFDFELSKEDMNAIKSLDTGNSFFFSHQEASTVELFLNLIKSRRNQN